jgi:methylenetetrahydrofolate dehydrogenase (NADP+)/methenyltetrahydrofolate cyclohydrolase
MAATRGPRIIDGAALAREVLEALKARTRRLPRPPTLHTILPAGDPSSGVYARSIGKQCLAIGAGFDITSFERDAPLRRIRGLIRDLNEDPEIHGILILGPARRRNSLIPGVWPWKDVEGIHPENLGRLFGFRTGPLPSTARAVMHILERSKVKLRGKNAVIVGASDIVGKPLSIMLARTYATPDLCHIFTKNLKEHTLRADILVVAAGKPGLIEGDMVKKGAIVIDVGINRVGNRIVGDVEFEDVKRSASMITPVPGGVGPVTLAMLMENLVDLTEAVS